MRQLAALWSGGLTAASLLLLALYAGSTGSHPVVLQPQPEFVHTPEGTLFVYRTAASFRAILPVRVEVRVPLLLPANTTVTVTVDGGGAEVLGPGGRAELTLSPGAVLTVNATVLLDGFLAAESLTVAQVSHGPGALGVLASLAPLAAAVALMGVAVRRG